MAVEGQEQQRQTEKPSWRPKLATLGELLAQQDRVRIQQVVSGDKQLSRPGQPLSMLGRPIHPQTQVIFEGDTSWKVDTILPNGELTISSERLKGKGMPWVTTVFAAQVCHVQELDSYHGQPNLKDIRHFLARKRNLRKQATLTENEYKELFGGTIRQKTGNCYMIAAFHSLEHFALSEEILRAAIERVPGTEETYRVWLPFGSPHSHGQYPVTVSPQDLEPSWHFVKDASPAEQKKFQPVDAAKGWKILEAAMIKKKFGSVDREKATGGLGHHTLLDIFENGAEKFLIGTLGKESLHQQKQKGSVVRFLQTLDNSKHIMTVNSLMPTSSQKMWYEVPSRHGTVRLWHRHAYSLIREGTRTYVVDPHNTSVRYEFGYTDFCKAFSEICGVSVNLGAPPY